jgi:hypothetical protein
MPECAFSGQLYSERLAAREHAGCIQPQTRRSSSYCCSRTISGVCSGFSAGVAHVRMRTQTDASAVASTQNHRSRLGPGQGSYSTLHHEIAGVWTDTLRLHEDLVLTRLLAVQKDHDRVSCSYDYECCPSWSATQGALLLRRLLWRGPRGQG